MQQFLENGKQQVTINTTGHNPKDIKVDVTETEIKIVSKKDEKSSRFVSDIDLTLTVGTDYDGTKTEAKFENGLLTLLIDKKADKKSKSLKNRLLALNVVDKKGEFSPLFLYIQYLYK